MKVTAIYSSLLINPYPYIKGHTSKRRCTRMNKYETMLITSGKLDDEANKALVAKFTGLIEQNGSISTVDEWGKRRLAYPINKENDAYYTLINFESGPDFPAELTRIYNITEGVLRSLIVDDIEVAPKETKKAAKAVTEVVEETVTITEEA